MAETADKQIGEYRLLIQYIGMAALFGRLIDLTELRIDDRAAVERAFADLNVVLDKRGTGTRFERASNGGYAAFRTN